MYELDQLPLGAQQLHKDLAAFVTKICCDSPIHTLGSGAPPMVLCLSCGTYIGDASWEWWEELRRLTELTSYYRESIYQYRHLIQPSWEVFMVTETPSVIQDPDLRSMLSVMPGHIIWETSDRAQDGQHCLHKFVIHENPDNPIPEAKCILCGGVRSLSEGELGVIDEATQMGVVFLKWKDRFEELSNLKGSKKARRKRRKGGSRSSKATGGVETAASVPEGYILVKEAAIKLGLEAKKLRRQIRAGHYPGVKCGGKVHVKID